MAGRPRELRRLTPRLHALAQAVVREQPMADVGTDHALLPAWLCASGWVPHALACDIADAPLDVAARTLARMRVEAVELRRGDGLAPIREGEVGTIVLAGMGGDRICRLLTEQRRIATSVPRLVLQPNTGPTAVRRLVAAHGWRLEGEVLVREGSRFYVVMRVDPRTPARTEWSDLDLELGPCLRREASPAFTAYVEERAARLRRAYDEGARVGSPRLDDLASAWSRLEAELTRLASRSTP